MDVADTIKIDNLSNIQASALYALAAPSVPESARVKWLARGNALLGMIFFCPGTKSCISRAHGNGSTETRYSKFAIQGHETLVAVLRIGFEASGWNGSKLAFTNECHNSGVNQSELWWKTWE